MFNKKLVLGTLLAITLSTSSLGFAEGNDDDYLNNTKYTHALSTAGLLKGSNGSFDLQRKPTRAESSVMLIRIIGKEEEALKKDYSHPFTDVPDWASPYVGYMYQKGLTKGISASKFGSEDLINGNSFATLMLRSLGYDDKAGDFSWADALDFMYEKGMIPDYYAFQLNKEFKRKQMVELSYVTLKQKYKDSDTRPIEKLIDEEVVTYSDKLDGFFEIREEKLANFKNNSNEEEIITKNDNKKETVTTVEKKKEVVKEIEESPRVVKLLDKFNTVNTTVGQEVYLPNQVHVKMDDGSEADFGIRWDQDQLNDSKYKNYYRAIEPGSYTIEGKVYLHEYFDVSIDVAVEGKIEFTNKGLRKLVDRIVYNKDIDKITSNDLLNIKELDFIPKDYGLSNFKNIELLANIEKITLRAYSENVTFDDLSKLDNLTYLKVNDINPDNIKDIFDIESLEYLEIFASKDLDNLDGIDNLTNLKTLVIKDYIRDTSGLEKIKDDVEITWMRKSYEETAKLNAQVFEAETRNNKLEENQNYAEEKAKDIVAEIISDDMSDEEKVKVIHDYIVTHVKYDHENYNKNTVPSVDHTLYGALVNGMAVCDGFAYSFDELAKEAGLDTEIIRGNVFATSDDAPLSGHAWNIVNINGNYRHVDTSSGNLRNFSDPIRYDYFNKTGQEFWNTHKWDKNRYPNAD
ncbi:MAG: Ig-like domain-containing protein [Firmicutes bacterium]|jgi:hypothetical protein|nr:Ig-like domain-containing protein [Bacillota bacterium]